MSDSVKILQEWIERDRAIRNNSTETDFDKFCEEKNLAIEDLLNRVKELDRRIEIKDNYIELAIDIACDYDGYERPEDLKHLIDEIVGYNEKALENVVNEVMFWGGDHYYNILHEEIKPKEGDNENE